MAVRIIGQIEGAERDAAQLLGSHLSPAFRPEDSVTIVAGAKCYGEKRQDVDLLVIGLISGGFQLSARRLPQSMRSQRVYLSSFLMAIEVKDHDSSNVRLEGNQIHVRYGGAWSNASKQAFEQANSVRNYLERKGCSSPFVCHATWLRNVGKKPLGRNVGPLLGSDLDVDQFLLVVTEQRESNLRYQLHAKRPHLFVTACKREDAQEIRNAVDTFTRVVEPARLDRRKLELICQRILKGQRYVDRIGKQLLIFRGRGGSGKTIRLLQIAKGLHDEYGSRVLFLTYNKALVSDVRRLLALLSIGDSVGEPGIGIRSSDSFFFGLLHVFGLAPERDEVRDTFPDDYPDKQKDMLDVLRATSPEELRRDRLSTDHPDLFAWDHVLIDEGQDWEDVERDIVFALFGRERVIVADGVDQMVRRDKVCDWTLGSDTSNRQIVRLSKSLRLKANLCRFARSFAEAAGLEWDLEANEDVPGGRIQIVLNGYTRAVHERLMSEHCSAGNEPIDALFCVTGASGARSLQLPKTLSDWGLNVWDGTLGNQRNRFPTEIDQHRIVRYQSCRGLEGWTVVCLDLHRFYDRQRERGKTLERDLLSSPEEFADRFATRWCLIPFTRAIDTLVIELAHQSTLARRLLPLAKAHSDFVEILYN